MAILNDLKKLLFGAKAVTKSAADKTVETGSEAWEKTKDTAEAVGKVVLEKTGEAVEKAAEFAENVGSKILHGTKAEKEEPKDDFTGSQDTADDEPVLIAQKEASGDAKEEGGKDDIMDAILADTGGVPAPALEEETLELPQMKTVPQEPETRVAPEDENDLAEKSGKALDKAADMAENVGKKVQETGGRMAEKFGEKAEEVGGVIFEKSGEAMERAKHLAEDIGSKILKAKDDLVKRAEEEAAKSGERADSLLEKAKDLGQKLEDKLKGKTDFEKEFADKPLDIGGSELNKHGSFWEKADRYGKGDYHNQGEQLKPGEMKIQQNPDYQPPAKGKVKGFDDHDGDGDELIDDAIMDDEK